MFVPPTLMSGNQGKESSVVGPLPGHQGQLGEGRDSKRLCQGCSLSCDTPLPGCFPGGKGQGYPILPSLSRGCSWTVIPWSWNLHPIPQMTSWCFRKEEGAWCLSCTVSGGNEQGLSTLFTLASTDCRIVSHRKPWAEVPGILAKFLFSLMHFQ